MNALGAEALFNASVTLLEPRVLASRGWVIHDRTFPMLDLSFRDPARQELRLRFACDDWNDSPPSVELLAPDGTHLSAVTQQRAGATIFNGSAHPSTGRPFVCMIGIREYHQHSSHTSDGWSNYKTRDCYTLGNIIEQLWRGWWRFWP